MSKENLQEEFFRHLTETTSPTAEGEAISHLAAKQVNANAVPLPPALWNNIQKKIAETPVTAGGSFGEALKAFFSPPLVPAIALGVGGILVGAFLLMNQGTTPAQVPLVEISAATPKQKGDTILARGLKIENLGGGSVAHIAGATDKIILESGSWKMALVHNELEKPVQFVFPGGALEPLGTAFTVNITKEGTAIDLTEGRIRLYEYQSTGEKWKSGEISAPYHGNLKPRPVNTDIGAAEVIVEKKPIPVSKYAAYIGKDITVELKNGDRLSGKLRTAAGGKLSLSAASGNLSIREADVLKINRN